jgi:ribosome maturation factor RimP
MDLVDARTVRRRWTQVNTGGDMARKVTGTPDAARLQVLLEPTVATFGADLEAVEVVRSGQRSRVCVIVDRDGGVDLDGIADVSKAVSEVLDRDDAMGAGPYTLEVTSPGVDRPLTQPRHWRRNANRLVTVMQRDGVALTARIIEADDNEVVLSPGDGPADAATAVRMPWSDIDKGLVQIEFRRPDPVEGEG